MEEPTYHRHDISDLAWGLLESTFPERNGAWSGKEKTTACLSMRFSGFCSQMRRGGICHPSTATEKTHSNGLPLVGQRRLGSLAGKARPRTWVWMAEDWCQPHKSSSPCGRSQGRQPGFGGHKRRLNSKVHWPWMRMVCQSEYLLQQVPLQIVHRLQPWSKAWMPNTYWRTNATIATPCWQRSKLTEWRRWSRHAVTRKQPREYDR